MESKCNVGNLMAAITRDDLEVVESIVSQNQLPVTVKMLTGACQNNSSQVFKFLAHPRRGLSRSVLQSLTILACTRSPEILEYLLKTYQVDIGIRHLELAVSSGRIATAKFLIQSGVQPTSHTLELACQHSNSTLAHMLLDSGCLAEAKHLNLACKHSSVDLVQRLVEGGLKPRRRHLDLAARTYNVAVVAFLIKNCHMYPRIHHLIPRHDSKASQYPNLVDACFLHPISEHLDIACKLGLNDTARYLAHTWGLQPTPEHRALSLKHICC